LLERNPAEAAAAFDRAAALFQKAEHYRDMALTLRRAGEAYQEAGDAQRAEDRLSRATRSLAAQGEKAEWTRREPSRFAAADNTTGRQVLSFGLARQRHGVTAFRSLPAPRSLSGVRVE